MKLDKKDRQILFELDKNARQSNAQIAKRIRLSEQLVGYRIKRMAKDGVIGNFITLLNPARLGYTHFKVYMRLQYLSQDIEKGLIETLVKNPHTFWVVSCRGRWDIIVSFFAKNVKEFGKIFREFLNRYDRYIAQRNVVGIEEAPSFTRGYLLPTIERKEFEYGGIPEVVKLDKKDMLILKKLSQNARISLLELAEEMNISGEAVRQRIKNLESMGVIQGYGMIINLKEIGYEHYLVSVALNRLDNETWRKLSEFVRISKNILFMPRCIGNHDIDFEMEVESNEEFNGIMENFRTLFNVQIRDFESNLIVKQHKFDYFPMEIE